MNLDEPNPGLRRRYTYRYESSGTFLATIVLNETSHSEQNGTQAKKRLSRLSFVESATVLNAPEPRNRFSLM